MYVFLVIVVALFSCFSCFKSCSFAHCLFAEGARKISRSWFGVSFGHARTVMLLFATGCTGFAMVFFFSCRDGGGKYQSTLFTQCSCNQYTAHTHTYWHTRTSDQRIALLHAHSARDCQRKSSKRGIFSSTAPAFRTFTLHSPKYRFVALHTLVSCLFLGVRSLTANVLTERRCCECCINCRSGTGPLACSGRCGRVQCCTVGSVADSGRIRPMFSLLRLFIYSIAGLCPPCMQVACVFHWLMEPNRCCFASCETDVRAGWTFCVSVKETG